MSLSLSVGLSTAASEAIAAPPDGGAEPEPTDEERAELERAQKLYEEGSASFSAADYEGAIEKFTAVLRIAETSDSFGHHVRSALLLNLARAHRSQYRIDNELKRLRLALEIYERLLREAEANLYPPEDVAEAEQGRDELKAQIAEREAASKTPAPVTDEPVDTGEPEPDRKRGLALGLVVGGSVLTAAGLGFVVLGTRYTPRAEQEAEGRTDLEPQVIDDFLAAEKRKGTGWIIGGAVAGAAGVGLLVTGAVLLAKHKNKPSAQARRFTPTFAVQPGYSGVGLVGRF